MLLVMCGATASAQTVPGDDTATPQEPVWVGPARTVRLFPAGDVYPPYVADIHRPTTTVASAFYTHTRIEQSGAPRTFLASGGRLGVLRVDSSAPKGRAWQVSIDVGFDALFDSKYNNDVLGWDGNYGLTVTSASAGSRAAFRVGVLHQSSHMGDEYQERTGTPRTNYTREEVAVGADWRFRPGWRAYVDVGVAYLMRSEAQERGRWQTGVEAERKPTVFGGRMAWYAAADVSAMAERDWRFDVALQGGLLTRSSGRTHRLYVQWYDGRVPLGQFTQVSEASFSLGWKMDL
jgi:hypothetical protein